MSDQVSAAPVVPSIQKIPEIEPDKGGGGRLRRGIGAAADRTWPVFTVALAALLGLMLLPGLTALHRSESIYAEVRASQSQFDTAQRAFKALSDDLATISIAVREFLLDNAPDAGPGYRDRLAGAQRDLEENITRLRQTLPAHESPVLDGLATTVDEYAATVSSVFAWTPDERQKRAVYFLRDEQRPTRRTILAVAGSLAELNASVYAGQEQRTTLSEGRFRQDLQQSLLLAAAAGLVVSLGGILRMRSLERRASRGRLRAEETTAEIRGLSARLRQAQEEERRTISRELHDEVGQMLTAMRMELGSLERLRTDDRAFEACLDDVKALAEHTLHLIRDIAAALRPSVLDDLGLGAAVQKQARDFSKRTGIRVSVAVAGEFGRLDDRGAIDVYRIVQEALTNCAKHAHAREIHIALTARDEGFDLSVHDDGAGFDYPAVAHAGLGLIGMDERARELGGTVAVRSRVGHGTLIDVHVPRRGTHA